MDGLDDDKSIALEQYLNNVLSRIVTGPPFDEDELAKIMKDAELRLENSKSEIKELEGEIAIALEESNNHVEECKTNNSAMQCFLNNAIQACELNVGKEDYILADMTSFCQRNCLSIPSPRLADEKVHQSNLSLNTCIDKEEESLCDLWHKLFLKFKNGLIKLLKSTSQLQPSFNPEKESLVFNNRQRLFELLCSLYPFEDAWRIYCCFRKEQLYNTSSGKEHACNGDDKLDIDCLFEELEKHNIMIKQDINLFDTIEDTRSKVESKNLLDCYVENAEFILKKILCSYEDNQDSSIGCTDSSLVLEISNFSATDVNTFAKLFKIYDDWSMSLKHLTDVLFFPEQNDLSNLVSTCNKVAYANQWNWQTELQPFVPIFQKLIPSFISCTFDVIMKKDDSSGNKRISVDCNRYISKNYVYDESKDPLQVSSRCATLVTVFSDIVVYLKFDKSKVLTSLSEIGTSSIIDALNEYIRISKQSIEFLPDYSGMDIDEVYRNVCDNIFLENQLESWESICENNEKAIGRFYFVINSLKELREECVLHIIRYHLFVIKTSVVYDIHSNNWEQDAYFFEGERCSFAIQMWNLYMRGVFQDLFTQFPFNIAKRIIKEISNDMLVFFSCRYTYMKVAYKKTKQIKSDILILLSFYKWLMLLLVEDVSDYLDIEDLSFYLWHKLCCKLLQTVVTLVSPISLVVDHLKENRGIDFPKDGSKLVPWFNYIGKNQFLVDNPILLLFEIVLIQPFTNIQLLSKLLTVQKGKFSLLLFKYVHDFVEPIFLESKTDQLKGKEALLSSKKVMSVPMDKFKFISSIYSILQHTSHASFVYFMENLIGCDTSKSFKALCYEDLPLWLKLITMDLETTLRRILNPSIDLLLHEEKMESVPKFPFTHIQKLPCGCPTVSETDKKKFENESSLLFHCLVVTLDMLVTNLFCIPQILWDVLVHVKINQNIKVSWIEQSNIGTKILGCLLYNYLTMSDDLKQTNVGCVNEKSSKKLNKFAELLWHVIHNLTYDVTDNPNICMKVYDYMKDCSDEIDKKLSTIDSYCNKKTLNALNEETLYSMSTADIFFLKKEGCNAMEYVVGVLKMNEKVLRSLLGTGDTSVVGKVGYNIKESNNIFDPMTEFECIGVEHLNHHNFIEAELDWSAMLKLVPAHWVRGIVFNRFEFLQESSCILNDEEQQFVAEIKAIIGEDKFSMETGSS